MYVVNFYNGGFVIISATTTYYPILAFSETNQFPVNTFMNSGLSNWIVEVKNEITSSVTFDNEKASKIRLAWLKYESFDNNFILNDTKSATTARDAFVQRRNELHMNCYDGWRLYSLKEAEGILSIEKYNVLCNTANSYGSPIEYTLIGIRDISRYSHHGPLLTTI